MKKIVFLILGFFIFFHGFANAGVNSVGNGGGLAELEFIFYFNNTTQIIDFCLQSKTQECKISTEQKKQWENLQLELTKHLINDSIDFTSEGDQPWKLQKEKLIINSQFLYNKDGSMMSESDVIAFALAVQFNLLNLNYLYSFKDLLIATKSSLAGFQFSKRTTELYLDHRIYFHQINVSNKEKNLSLFAIEEPNQSIQLNEIMQKQQPDFDVNAAEFNQVSGLIKSDKVMFYGLTSSRHFRLEIYFKPGTTEIDPEHINFQISVE